LTLRQSLALRWFLLAGLYFVLGFATYMLDKFTIQPFIYYCDGTTSLTLRHILSSGVLGWACAFALCIGILYPFDLMRQGFPAEAAEYDLAYYPTIPGLRRALRVRRARVFLVVGTLLVAGYGAHVAITLWSASFHPHGSMYPPHYVFAICAALWSVLWLGDCLARPRRGTTLAAVGYAALALFVLVKVEFFGAWAYE